MLVLNYLHKGLTNPPLLVRDTTTGFPLLNKTTLGTDESWSLYKAGSWGHLPPAVLSQVGSISLLLWQRPMK